MKIALMTWHSYNNFGSVLQAFALVSAVRELGHDIDLIDYDPLSLIQVQDYSYKALMKKKIKDILKESVKNTPDVSFFKKPLINAVHPRFVDSLRDELYDIFRTNYFNYTDRCITASDFFDLNKSYDGFLCGSDQIWAPTCFNPHYFLDFVADPNRMMAYAPSIGLPEVQNEDIAKHMSQLIARFNYLSVREEEGANVIEELIGIRPQVVADPTLLYDGQYWAKIAKNVHNTSDSNYLLCYFLKEDKTRWKGIAQFAQRLGLDVKVIPVFKSDITSGFETVNGAGPAEFLHLVKCASFVLTDSFHGTLFSILFEKQFYCIKRFSDSDRKSQNSRIYNILRIAGLADRFIDFQEIESNVEEISFDQVRSRIDTYRNSSWEYLRNAISGIESATKLKHSSISAVCCGCGGCAVVCPRDAVEISTDHYGFIQSTMDVQRCIDCGLCERVCPFSNRNMKHDLSEAANVYAYMSNDDVLKKSSSGGFARDAAYYALVNDYLVCGCADGDIPGSAEHILVTDLDELSQLQGSKYAQSKFVKAFDLLTVPGRKIVIGTPCQIAAIHNLAVMKDVRNDFVLIDLICHGVPTANLIQRCVEKISSRIGHVDKIIYRNKEEAGWQDWQITYMGDEETLSFSQTNSVFYHFFEAGYAYCLACYDCEWRHASCADIRIGDYWGEKYANNHTGVSIVIAMNKSGDEFINNIAGTLHTILLSGDLKDYDSVQQTRNELKPIFWERLQDGLATGVSLEQLDKEFCTGTLKRRKTGKLLKKFKHVLSGR